MGQNKSLVIGITGGIATGKSTVSRMFIEKGINVIDADIIGREVIKLYPDILKKIEEEFGLEYISGGELDRKKIGDLVFENKESRDKLEKIIIPYIKKEIFQRVEKKKENGDTIIIVDAPTLFENGLEREMDKVILVYLEEELQVIRLIKRNSLTYKKAYDRIKAQIPIDEKKRKSHYVLYNHKDLDFLKDQFNKLFKELEDETKK